MIGLLGDSALRYASLLGAAFRPWRPRRVLVMAAFVPLFTLVQAVHWIGLLLDEVLFPGFRKTPVTAPLFVLGVPRSGTTMVHRVLARDDALTTFRTWECFLAPSITQRKVILAVARIDRAVGRPGGRLIRLLERGIFGGLDDVHAMDLMAPEEDYLALLPVMACFILVIPFPTAAPLWRMATFDRDMPPGPRGRLLRFYHGLLQRHLYVHGTDKRLLSKNAAFAGMAGALQETFPDARFLRCHRDPRSVVPSQLSSIQGGVRLFDSDPGGRIFTPRMLEVLRFYYENLDRHLPAPDGERHVTLDMRALKEDLFNTIAHLYEAIDQPLTPAFREALAEEANAARAYRSSHRYDAADFGLDETAIATVFASVQTWNWSHTTDARATPEASAPAGQQGA